MINMSSIIYQLINNKYRVVSPINDIFMLFIPRCNLHESCG